MSVRHIFASVLLCSGAAALVAGCSSESDGGSPNSGGSGAQTAGTGAGVGGSGTSGAAGTAAGGTGVVPQGGSGTTAGAGGTGTAGAGTGGTNATAGAGGTGTAGAGGGGGFTVPRGKSMGCGKQNEVNEPGKFTKHDIEVTGVDPYWGTVKMPYVGNGNPGNYTFTHRNYFVRLPSNYDPNKAYPLVFGGGGCGGDTLNGNGGGRDMLSNDTRNDAISIGLSYFWPDGAGACFGDEYENTYEIPYWESVYQEVTKDLCVDLEKVFIAGYSSGAWMAYTTALAKGGKVRGMGAGAGGIREKHPPRANIPFAAMLITGKDDGGNPVHKTKDKTTCNGTEAEGCWLGKIICGFPGAEDCYDTGSANGRDEILKLNGCVGTATQQYDRFPDCKQYTGCPAAFPVVYCLVEGGHTEGGDRFNPGIWEFWSKLPAVP